MARRLVMLAACLAMGASTAQAGPASGAFKAQKDGSISPTFATGYAVRNSRNAREMRTEVLLTDVAIDAAPFRDVLDPHMVAINLEALEARNYILLWVSPDGTVSMNATFVKGMTQYLADTNDGLKAELEANTPTRVEGRLYSPSPLKTMDGTQYSVDVKFAVDMPVRDAGTPLPAGGGDAGNALMALMAAVGGKNWPAIKAGSSPRALHMFEASYRTAADNAEAAKDLLTAWLPAKKVKVTTGELHGTIAILDVEGEIFDGQLGLSRVKMVKAGSVWQFDEAAKAGMIR